MTTLSEPPWLPRYPGPSTGVSPQPLTVATARDMNPSPPPDQRNEPMVRRPAEQLDGPPIKHGHPPNNQSRARSGTSSRARIERVTAGRRNGAQVAGGDSINTMTGPAPRIAAGLTSIVRELRLTESDNPASWPGRSPALWRAGYVPISGGWRRRSAGTPELLVTSALAVGAPAVRCLSRPSAFRQCTPMSAGSRCRHAAMKIKKA
jgi:hypothetical protein